MGRTVLFDGNSPTVHRSAYLTFDEHCARGEHLATGRDVVNAPKLGTKTRSNVFSLLLLTSDSFLSSLQVCAPDESTHRLSLVPRLALWYGVSD